MKNKYIILALTFLYMLIGQQSYGQDYNEDAYGNPIVNDTVFLPELPITSDYTDVDNTPDIYLQYSHYLNNTGNYCLLCDDDIVVPDESPAPLPTVPIITPDCWYCDENNNYAGVGVSPVPPISANGSAYREYNVPGHYRYIIDYIGPSGYATLAVLYGTSSSDGRLFLSIPVAEVRALGYIMSSTDQQYHYEFYQFIKLNPVIGLKILKAYTASANKEDAFINNLALALIAGNAEMPVAMAAIVIPRIIQYYNYELNRLRMANPTWSEFKLKSTAALNLFQTGLDIIGLVPAVGEVADLVNGGIYLVRGDLANATISGLALIPIGGQAATGSRLVIKIVDGVAVPIAKGADAVAALVKFTEKIDAAITTLKVGARYVTEGTGAYITVLGHHPLAKKAFEGIPNYDFKKAFSVSSSALDNASGITNTHAFITGQQNSLYSAWKNANPNITMTIDAMADIEIQAMKNVGIPEDIAKGWVVKALEDLKKQGVDQIKNIPWNSVNP